MNQEEFDKIVESSLRTAKLLRAILEIESHEPALLKKYPDLLQGKQETVAVLVFNLESLQRARVDSVSSYALRVSGDGISIGTSADYGHKTRDEFDS